MPLCSFSILRKNILMSVLLFNICQPGTRHYYASAVPLQSLSESKTEEINSNYVQETPLEQQGKGLPLLQRETTVTDKVPISSPSNVHLSFLNVSSVLITWSYPGDGDQVHFIVQRSYDGDAYKNASGTLNVTQFVYTGMKFSAYYQFQVIACVGSEVSPPTETDYFINGITAPPGPPVNVVAMVMSYDVINLQWDAPHTPSPVIYLVEWGTNESHLNHEKTVVQSTHVSFSSLQLNTTYYFQVKAEINSWTSAASPLVVATTLPPNLPALTVQANASDKWVLIIWSNPSDDRYPQTIASYKVFVSSNKTLDSRQLNSNIFTVSPTQSSFNVTGLQPGSVLIVTVAYTSSSFQSEMSRPLHLETLEDVVCGSCAPLSSTRLRITYTVLTSLNKTRTISVLESALPLTQVCTQNMSGFLVVSDLRPWTGHSLTVALETTSGKRQSDLCPLLYCWTKEAAPSEPPTNIRLTAISTHSMSLSWSEPRPTAQNGIITKYAIGYQCSPRYTGQDCRTLQLDITANKPNNISATIEYLSPFTMYSVVLSASTSVGRGPLSFPITLTTKQDAPTTPPTVTNITNITATSFYISWTPPSLETRNGEIISYKISLLTVPNNCNDINENGTLQKGGEIVRKRLGTKFGDLLAATTYAVIVSAFTSAGESPLSEPVCVSTLPSATNTLILNVNFTADATPSIVEDVCFNLTFGWYWPVLLQPTSSVSLATWSIFIHYHNNNIMSNSSQTASVFVGNDVLVTMVIFSEFNHSTSLEGNNITFWLEINGFFSNNSSFQIQSHRKIVSLPTCSLYSSNWVLITSVCVVAALGCATLTCLTVCCGYLKWKKKQRVISQGVYVMDNFVPPDLEENDYLLDPTLRISDGQLSSTENSRTSSESLYDSSTSSQRDSDSDDSELLDLGADASPHPKPTALKLPPANGMSEGPLKPRDSALVLDSLEAECRPQALPLAPRQNPDGCSLSSSTSSESTALIENEGACD